MAQASSTKGWHMRTHSLILVILFWLCLRTAIAFSGKESYEALEHQRIGLLKLYEGENPTIDIIAVHGLDGDRRTAWQASNNVSWIQDLLPQYASSSRVFAYGYNADTSGPTRISNQFMFNLADSFVSDIVALRHQTNSHRRPIIFIAHSLGGILVKSALIRSSLARDEIKKSLKLSTYGIFYFGTPHQGATGVSFSRQVLRLTSIFRPTNDRILRHLKVGSEWLQEQLDQYHHISSDFVTKFLYETQPTKVAPGVSLMLVPYYSAVIPGWPNAEAVGLEADHITMVKFHGQEDINFQRVMAGLTPMLDDAPTKVSSNWATHDRALLTLPLPQGCPYHLSPKLPYDRNNLFVGRAREMSQLDQLMRRSTRNNSRIVTVLHGTGGMGKSQIALEFAYRNLRQYSAIFWVNAKSREAATADFVAIARKIYPHWNRPVEAPNDPLISLSTRIVHPEIASEALELVKDWLCKDDNDKWLLIFDNVDDLESFNLRKEFFPWASQGSIIITSRRSQSKRLGNAHIEVDEMDPCDSRKLLQASAGNYSPSNSRDEGLDELVEELRHLPLALDQAGAYIDAQQITYLDYLARYRQDFASVAARRPSHSVWDYENTIFTTWEVSLSALEAQDKRSETCASLLFLLMGFFNPHTIDQMLFERIPPKLTFEIESCDISASFETLLSYSLIKRKERGKTFSIHPVVQTWARERLPRNEKVLFVRLTTWILFFNLILKDLPSIEANLPGPLSHHETVTFKVLRSVTVPPIRTLELQRSLLPHLQTCVEAYTLFFSEENPLQIPLLWSVTVLFEPFGFWRQAETLYKRILEQFAPFPPDHQADIVETSSNLAAIYWRLNKLEDAERLQRKLVFEIQSMDGEQSIAALEAVLFLARIYISQNRLQLAENLLNSVVSSAESDSLFPHHSVLQVARQDLAWITHKRGSFADAANLQSHLAEEANALWGPLHPITITISHDLALTFLEQGRSQEAQQILKRILDDHISFYSPQAPSTLVYKSNLARAYANQSDFDTALSLMAEVRIAWQKILPDHPAAALSALDIADFHRQMGNVYEAEQVQETGLVFVPSDVDISELRRGWTADASNLSPWACLFIFIATQHIIRNVLLTLLRLWFNMAVPQLWTDMRDAIIQQGQCLLSLAKGQGHSPEAASSLVHPVQLINSDMEALQSLLPHKCFPILDWVPERNGSRFCEDSWWGFWATMPLLISCYSYMYLSGHDFWDLLI